MHPGDHGFLAAVLQPGMRALTIGVDAITGTAGLIWPGDRVDLILTLVLPDNVAPPGRRVAAETALTDVRVIAIDQQLVQGASPGSVEQTARTVTLEVNRDQAERVSVAMRLGRLSLAVRSADTSRQASEPHGQTDTVWASDVSAALSHDVAVTVQHAVRVFPGSADSKEFHF
jgi:pilus assembly protein CpaB